MKNLNEIFFEDWVVETARRLEGIRIPRLRRDIPEEVDEQYYANWIGWQGKVFWTPWIIWDIDAKHIDGTPDPESALDKVRIFVHRLFDLGVSERALRVVFSTSKGFHVYLDSRTVNLQPSEDLHAELQQFAISLLPGCDESFYSKRRLVGVPNSLHRKTRLYYVSVDLDDLFMFNVEQLRSLADSPQNFRPWADEMPVVPLLLERFNRSREEKKTIQRHATTSAFTSRLQTDEELKKPHEFFYGVSEGERNLAMYQLARDYKWLGLAMEETLVLCRHANSNNRPTPLSRADLEKHVRSAYKTKVKPRTGS